MTGRPSTHQVETPGTWFGQVRRYVTSPMSIKGKGRAQAGVALVMVLVTLAIITITTHQFVYKAEINYASAKNMADELKAEYLARSVVNLSRLLFKVQDKVIDRNRTFLGDLQLTDYMDILVPLFFGQGSKLLAGMIGVDPKDIQGLDFKKGYGHAFLAGKPEAEDGKININCAYVHSDQDPQVLQLVASLRALFADRRYDFLFEQQDAHGNYNDRDTVIRALIDYVDTDHVMFGQSSAAEDYGYQSLDDPYEAKNNIVDSVEELRLVRGVTDDFWANFGPSLTVYGQCIPNLCAIPDDNWILVASLLYQTATNPADPVFRNPIALRALSQAVLQQVKMTGCNNLNAFVSAAKNPLPIGQMMTGLMGGSTSQTQPDIGNQDTTVGMLEGIELDPAKVSKAVYMGPRRYYKIVAVGQSGRVTKTITAVWDQQFRSPSTGKLGTFVYWKER